MVATMRSCLYAIHAILPISNFCQILEKKLQLNDFCAIKQGTVLNNLLNERKKQIFSYMFIGYEVYWQQNTVEKRNLADKKILKFRKLL